MSAAPAIVVVFLIVAGACSSAPDPNPAIQEEAQPVVDSTSSTRAAELAVKVANNTATPAEAAELDAFIKGRK